MERLEKILNTLNEYDKYLMRELREPTDKNVSLYEYWIDYKYDIEKQIEGMKNLEKQGKLLKLPCDTVWFICDKNTKYATVMPRSIRDLTVCDIEGIDEKGYYWSTRDKALAVLKEL